MLSSWINLEDSLSSDVHKRFIRRVRKEVSPAVNRCFFCDSDADAGESLHKASTLEVDARVRCAFELQGKPLLAKLSSEDVLAQDADINCLVALYNRARASKSFSSDNDVDPINHSIAFAELLS